MQLHWFKSAFRLLPVHPNDFDLLGFSINGDLYYDKCMPMGCSISCVTFERFSTFLRGELLAHVTLHYLDDFLFVGRLDSLECARALECAQALCLG